MAAYHTVAFAQNQAAIRETAIREHDGRLPQSPSHRTRQPSERRPSESVMAVYHAEPLTTQEPLPLSVAFNLVCCFSAKTIQVLQRLDHFFNQQPALWQQEAVVVISSRIPTWLIDAMTPGQWTYQGLFVL
ncbi:hypothetical protein DEO72_LG4g763 [Vigna unguiculata]|uniref:Uncharacterized protein n=1 Tax=Vigna unguiculata TaxID=3917 RepID=A0A4D6LMT2_VIGUN|nr:hypothetical protein DEO72_LG4g763 [Vigna unguiculata]